jgi:BMFP domain-containing protein YqiC
MSEWDKIKQSPEYREAADDVEERIRRHLRPIFKKLDEVPLVLEALEKRVAALETAQD